MKSGAPIVSRRITEFLICTTVLIVWILQASNPAVAGPVIATDKEGKPADANYLSPRISFDCTPLQTIELIPGYSQTLTGDTSGGSSQVPGYSCAPWMEEGPEHVYELVLEEQMEVFAGLRDIGELDFDLFLLNDCDTDSCLVGANIEFSIVLEPGTYHLVIDGAGSNANNAAQGPYSILMETRYIGLPPEICDPTGHIPIECQVQSYSMRDTTTGQPNQMQTYECSPIIERGGEIWYQISLSAYHQFTAQTTDIPANLDIALWLFDTCGTDAMCLDFADNELAGLHESITYYNNNPEPMTLYLGVDSYRWIENVDAGVFEISIECSAMVPNTTKSWGSIRAQYRGQSEN